MQGGFSTFPDILGADTSGRGRGIMTARKFRAQRRSRLLLILFLVLLTMALTAAGTLLYLTEFRPDIGYGLHDRFLGRRESLPLTEAEGETQTRMVPLQDIREGTAEGILYQNSLWLVNNEHRIDEELPLMLAEYEETELLFDRTAIPALHNLLAAARKETGDKVYLMSAYRTEEEQREEYRLDPLVAAAPGASEHQTGLAVDLYVYQKAQREFITAKAGRFIQEHAAEYGFIIRYPFGKEKITGIPYEPWHIRYVGKPHARVMYANRWTLEEYLEKLETGRTYVADGVPILRTEERDGSLAIPSDWGTVTVSADNMGGFILTGEPIDALQ